MPPETSAWPEATYTYPPGLREEYQEGRLFQRWFKKYQGHLLFCERMFTSRQIPHSGPLKEARGFHEFFMGTLYIDAGYEAMCFYRRVENEACYEQVCKLLGGDAAAQFVAPNSERGGRAPDLIVFELQTSRFRFVETKGRTESFTRSQVDRFTGIEAYLNGVSPPLPQPLSGSNSHLFPPLSAGRWIHVARITAE